ncbi:unnamed protein product [Natator depressus]
MGERDGQGAVSRQLRLLDHACSKWLPQQPHGPMLFLPIFHKQNKNQIKRLISVCTELAAGRRCGGR